MSKKRSGSGSAALRVVELFAGVGGFRIGLQRAKGFDVIWSNQWEPGKRKQLASDVYAQRFGSKGHVSVDIASVPVKEIPDHDLLVGGFPCQDYSVASSLKNAKGLVGKKGVLWWQIHRILTEKKNKPQYLLLENVDRLLGSPKSQRGRDFAVMLSSLDELGYTVEWRVINAADYGMPQRRRRVFIFASKQQKIATDKMEHWLVRDGLFAHAFPVTMEKDRDGEFDLIGNLAGITRGFNIGGQISPFQNAGIMSAGHVRTARVHPKYNGSRIVLGDLLQAETDVPKEYFVPRSRLKDWRYQKGAKNEPRSAANGHQYEYVEGAMSFPDPLDRPARTIVTGEGGASPSRFKHVVRTATGKYRRLTPVELERINMFPDNHTAGVPDGWRAFFMGNALVTGVVEKIGKEVRRLHAERSDRLR